MVCSYPHCCAVLFANINKRSKFNPYSFKLGFVFCISIFNLLEFFLISIITGINPDLFNKACRCFCCVGSKMNISNKRNNAAAFLQFLFNLRKIVCFIYTWGSNTHILTACFNHSYCLLNRGNCIHRICGSHGLNAYRVVPSKRNISYFNFSCFPSFIRSKAFAIICIGLYHKAFILTESNLAFNKM